MERIQEIIAAQGDLMKTVGQFLPRIVRTDRYHNTDIGISRYPDVLHHEAVVLNSAHSFFIL